MVKSSFSQAEKLQIIDNTLRCIERDSEYQQKRLTAFFVPSIFSVIGFFYYLVQVTTEAKPLNLIFLVVFLGLSGVLIFKLFKAEDLLSEWNSQLKIFYLLKHRILIMENVSHEEFAHHLTACERVMALGMKNTPLTKSELAKVDNIIKEADEIRTIIRE